MRRAVNSAADWVVRAFHAQAEEQRGRFAPFLAVAMVGGAAWFFAGPLNPDPRQWASIVLSGFVLAAVARRYAALLAIGLLAAAFGLGAGCAQFATGRMAPLVDVPSRAVEVTGTVSLVEPLPQGRRMALEAPSLDGGPALPRALRIRLRPGDPVAVVPGDRVRVRALFMRAVGAPWPGGWDIQFDAFFSGIGGFGYALGPVDRLEATAGSWAAWLAGLQQTIIARVHAALPGPEGKIAAGLMVGGATAIAPEDTLAWRNSGIYHLLSISGLHLAIAMGLVLATVRFGLSAWEWAALHLPVKPIAAVAALVSGGFYTLLTGAQVPMLRSFAMAALVTLAIVAGRRALSLRAWAMAMAGVVAVAPWAVAGVSFQMSFAAVLALVAGFEVLRPALAQLRGDGGWQRRAAVYGVGLVLTSALAGTAAAPFAAFHFGQMQVYYVLANLLAVPLTAVLVMPAAVLALFLIPLGWEQVALVPMGWGVAGLGAIARTVAGWPQASVRVPHILPWGLALFSLGFAWLALWRGRLRLVGVPAVIVGLGSALLFQPPDILVSGDARLIGLRTPEGLYVHRTQGGSSFVLDSWLALLSEREARPLPDPGKGDATLSCEAGACLFRPHGVAPGALLVLRAPAPRDACGAALVISPEPLRLECDEAVPVIDRFSVWRDGAQSAWLLPGAVPILTDREVRGTRPWVVPLTTRQRTPRGAQMPVADPDRPSVPQDDPVE